MRKTYRFSALAVVVLLSTGAGCSNVSDAGGGSVEAAPSGLTDSEVAHIAVTANTIDVEIARLAEPRSTSAEVQAFAQTMITDHTAVNEQAGALAQRLGVTPQDNPVSQSLDDGAAQATERLIGLSGGAFDQAYLTREVEYHQAVLDALDDALIPSAANPELRALLEEVRPVIAAHLERAHTLAGSSGEGQ